jgi:hypothetical protein
MELLDFLGHWHLLSVMYFDRTYPKALLAWTNVHGPAWDEKVMDWPPRNQSITREFSFGSARRCKAVTAWAHMIGLGSDGSLVTAFRMALSPLGVGFGIAIALMQAICASANINRSFIYIVL